MYKKILILASVSLFAFNAKSSTRDDAITARIQARKDPRALKLAQLKALAETAEEAEFQAKKALESDDLVILSSEKTFIEAENAYKMAQKIADELPEEEAKPFKTRAFTAYQNASKYNAAAKKRLLPISLKNLEAAHKDAQDILMRRAVRLKGKSLTDKMTRQDIDQNLKDLKDLKEAKNRIGMAVFILKSENTPGVSPKDIDKAQAYEKAVKDAISSLPNLTGEISYHQDDSVVIYEKDYEKMVGPKFASWMKGFGLQKKLAMDEIMLNIKGNIPSFQATDSALKQISYNLDSSFERRVAHIPIDYLKPETFKKYSRPHRET
jgi:hypothetical protein